MVEGVDWLFLGGGDIHDYTYYIRSPVSIEKNHPPRYSIIVPSFKHTELNKMKDRIQGIIEGQPEHKSNIVPLIEFLGHNVKKRIIIDDKK
jgi:hypothetical protein